MDEAVVEVLTRSIALDGLHLDMCEPAVGQRLRRILERTAEGVLRGAFPPVTVEGRTLDQTSQQQFAEAVRELLEMLRRGMES